MTPLHHAVDDYLALRRQLGVTLQEAGRVLMAFAAYAERERTDHLTTALVLRWASHLTHVSPATVHHRSQMIRRFAQWRQLTDIRTEIPPADLLPGRYRRRPPRLSREEDLPRLLAAAATAPVGERSAWAHVRDAVWTPRRDRAAELGGRRAQ